MRGDMVVCVSDLVKRYDTVTAVDHLSFDVYEGEIFGLLGPNGAGKTSTIRMLVDIFHPDEGEISVLGKTPGAIREQLGYLPEERGLYPKRPVLDTLVYLAQLKGLSYNDAHKRSAVWLERLGLTEWAKHRIQDLSRGMQQKIQFAAACVHAPRLVILDEPFQGLDPVNVEVIRGLMRDLRAEGTTIMLSAHEMNRIEELCDRIAIINHGQLALYGNLREIQSRYGSTTVRLRTDTDPGGLAGVESVTRENHDWLLTVRSDPQAILRQLVERGIRIDFFEAGTARLEQIFIDVVTKEQQHV